jgi:hypothetical protein
MARPPKELFYHDKIHFFITIILAEIEEKANFFSLLFLENGSKRLIFSKKFVYLNGAIKHEVYY